MPVWLAVLLGSASTIIAMMTCAVRIERRFNAMGYEIMCNRKETRRNRRLTGALVDHLFSDQKARAVFSAAMSDEDDGTEAAS